MEQLSDICRFCGSSAHENIHTGLGLTGYSIYDVFVTVTMLKIRTTDASNQCFFVAMDLEEPVSILFTHLISMLTKNINSTELRLNYQV